MKIINKLYSDWSPEMKRQLRSLSLRTRGSICKVVSKTPCDTFVLFDNNILVGWGIYLLGHYNGIFLIYNQGSFMLYVRNSYRKKGVGKFIIQNAIRKYEKLKVYPWDNNSGIFFKKVLNNFENSLEVNASNRYWIEKFRC